MAIVFFTAEELALDWRTYLKAIKPDVDVDSPDSNFYTFSMPIGQILSGISADLKAVNNDVFIQDARPSAIENFLIMYFNSTYTPATKSVGKVIITGTEGSSFNSGSQLQYPINGNTFLTTETVVIDNTLQALVSVESNGTGSIQNLEPGTTLNIPAPPPGINAIATVGPDGLRDGRDQETVDQARDRLLNRVRVPLSGGKATDYESFALEANPAVTGVSVWRYVNGPGSVGVIITSGTTDIDNAIDNNIPITFQPSPELIEEVAAYIETKKPVTDCVFVGGPVETIVDVTVYVTYSQGDGTTIPAGSTITQEEYVIRNVERAIWKTPVGGTQINGQGFVLASAIEDVLDQTIGNTQYAQGSYVQILSDRFVANLNGLERNFEIPVDNRPVPGVITVINGVP